MEYWNLRSCTAERNKTNNNLAEYISMQHAARELPLPQWITHLRGLDFSFFCDCHGSHLLHFPQPTKSPCLTGITLAFLCLSGFRGIFGQQLWSVKARSRHLGISRFSARLISKHSTRKGFSRFSILVTLPRRLSSDASSPQRVRPRQKERRHLKPPHQFSLSPRTLHMLAIGFSVLLFPPFSPPLSTLLSS